jgi:undecaprenyl-diphosphatase
MPPSLLQILLLGLIQGATELLPVSSSAHVIVAEKLMGLDPSSPEMTFLLAMLHTGTMFAVILFFWSAWQKSFGSNPEQIRSTFANLALATVYTLAIGFGLQVLIEKVIAPHGDNTEIEQLFSNLWLIAGALTAAGLLIIAAGLRHKEEEEHDYDMPLGAAGWIGAVQGLAIPFRGFSRSGATISVGLMLRVGKKHAEEFSFALGVILTPLAIAKELYRLMKARTIEGQPLHLGPLLAPGLIGMVASFVAGLIALRLLTRWLAAGKWQYFGAYCLVAAALVAVLAQRGL